MKKNLCYLVLLVLSFGMHSSYSIELKNAPAAPAALAGSTSSESGTVTSIDAKSGYIVLDGTRRFTFSPGTLMVRKQNNRSSSVNLAEVTAGARVSLTVVKSPAVASPKVTELWIAP